MFYLLLTRMFPVVLNKLKTRNLQKMEIVAIVTIMLHKNAVLITYKWFALRWVRDLVHFCPFSFAWSWRKVVEFNICACIIRSSYFTGYVCSWLKLNHGFKSEFTLISDTICDNPVNSSTINGVLVGNTNDTAAFENLLGHSYCLYWGKIFEI